MNFEEKMSRLKEICRLLSLGSSSLEETVSLYKEGMALSDECLQAIASIRSEIDSEGRAEKDE
ncbi:MAG TPA: exodeoxyribonuclease VII small subunit [Candidatus Faeciplasma avium]|uniref:Exodeoxyribonuclease 7 small subunit n=1 Tax=Candidatus Faeciplasma avium TaxID=2840798 RepID=A0A9D1NQX1_9FIRM|nr:exodeoxyribonuclease VII small subunit [Candidatus Faeciplasma avium]